MSPRDFGATPPDAGLLVDEAVWGLRGATKAAVLNALAQRAGDATGLAPQSLLAALLRREGLGSTGIGGGVALPHARLESVVRPFRLVARCRAPVPFEAVDDRPVDLVALLLLPADPACDPGNALAGLSRLLRAPGIAEALRAAEDAATMQAVLRGA